MEYFEWFKKALLRFKDFDGRSRRMEYWSFVLVNVVIGFVLGFIGGILGTMILSSLFSLVMLVPGIAVSIRRLHDIGKSGWWVLIALTGIGAIVLLYFAVQEGQPGSNQYGANPKGA